MKKQTYLCIAALTAALLALVCLAVYLTFAFGDCLSESTGAGASSQSEFHFETEPPAAETAAQPDHMVIWVGDSRTVGMQEAVNDECLYIAAAGEGYDWFAAYGEAQLREAIEAHPDAPVVFNLGVNDYDNLELYLRRYHSLTEEFSDTVFYFLSVNPIDPGLCQNITNEQISDFNSHLQEAFPNAYIDSYTFLLSLEISPFDGVHYSEEEYRMLHDYVVEQIQIG